MVRPLLRQLALVAAIAIAPVANAFAQDPTSPSSTIDLNGEVDLARLVDLCAQRLNLHIEYDASTLTGKVTLRLGSALTDDELWRLTNHALTARGFTTVGTRESRMISVVKIAEAQNLGRIEDPNQTGPGPGFVTVVTRVQHRSVKDTVEALRTILRGSTASVNPLGNSDLVVLTDVRARVEQAVELLARLDTPDSDAVFEVVPIKNTLATVMVTSVAELLSARENVSGRAPAAKLVALPDGTGVVVVAPASQIDELKEVIGRLDSREVITTESYAPRNFSLGEVAGLIEQVLLDPAGAASTTRNPFRAVRDELTGTLIVTATAAQHAQVRSLIARLDSVPRESLQQVRTFAIRNRPVMEVATLVQQLVAQAVLRTGELGDLDGADASAPAQQTRRTVDVPGMNRAPQGPTSVPSNTGANGAEQAAIPALTIAADEPTNTLLAVGEPRLLSQLEHLIERLDVRQPQVMLEVLVAALSESETLDLGIELEKIEQSGGTTTTLSTLFGLSSGGGTPGDSAGFTTSVVSPGDFSVFLRALETVNDGRTLTLPKVLVNNNEQATFDSVLQQPFISTNASDTVATTSFGGTQDAGTSIDVKPHIAEGDHLVLDYKVSLSNFVGEAASATVPPPRQQNNLQSVVTIPDGYAVIVGGLEVTSESEARSMVPWLGEVPILGELLGSRSASSSKTRFYVFLRANVLRKPRFEDLRYLSDRARDGQALEIPDDWPTVSPRMIR